MRDTGGWIVISYRALFLTLAAGAILAACGAKTASPLPAGAALPLSDDARADAPALVSRAAATLTITLPPIQPAGVPYPWTSTAPPVWLSSATASISGTIGKRHFGPIALGNGAAACATPAPGVPLQCSITVSARRGKSVRLTLDTYASATAIKPLATSSQSVTIFAGPNFATAVPLGVAQKIVTRAVPAALQQGQYSTSTLTSYGIDAAGLVIPGQLGNAAGINVRLSGFFNQNITLTCVDYSYCSPLKCCGVVTTFNYTGVGSETETIRTISEVSYNPTTTKVRVLPGSSQLGTVLVSLSTQNALVNLQFASGTYGDPAPVRAVELGGPAYGEDASGNYWVESTNYSNTGAVLGTITIPQSTAEPDPVYYQPVAKDQQGHIYAVNNTSCAFEEFPANTYGVVSPMRNVTCPGRLFAPPAFDDAGNVYIAPSNTTSPTVLEYGPTGSGNVPPIRTITLSSPAGGSFAALGCDGSGNLYALLAGTNAVLYEFAPGATTGQPILTGMPMTTFAVDNAGDITVVLQTYASTIAPGTIEFFPAGSSTPSGTISGPTTQLMGEIGAIAVPR
jgi:hypothetical protein